MTRYKQNQLTDMFEYINTLLVVSDLQGHPRSMTFSR